MTDKNSWNNDSSQPMENSGGSPSEPNPWTSEPQKENPWATNPETTAFPPVNGAQQSVPWNESRDFSHDGNEPHHGGSNHPHYTQPPAASQVSPARKGKWAIPVVIVLALIALIAGAVVIAGQAGLLNLSSGEDDDLITVTEVVVVPAESEDPQLAENDSASAPEAGEESDEVEAAAEAARPSRASLPGGAYAANSSARTGTPDGNFNNVYTGSSVTSQEFAQRVRSAFVDFYLETGETSGRITAYSPVTGLSYSMDCSDNGSFVTCAGGNNAIVYIS